MLHYQNIPLVFILLCYYMVITKLLQHITKVTFVDLVVIIHFNNDYINNMYYV